VLEFHFIFRIKFVPFNRFDAHGGHLVLRTQIPLKDSFASHDGKQKRSEG